MALTHVVDTSVLKRLANPLVRDRVEPMAAAGELARATVCDLEVGYSTRTGAEWDELIGALDIFARLDTTADHARRALQVQRLLAVKSQRGRKIPDLLVAAAAEMADLTVLHYDADFDRIATVTGQRCEWVVPAGSLDRVQPTTAGRSGNRPALTVSVGEDSSQGVGECAVDRSPCSCCWRYSPPG